jgi:orotate phosphoribosyltransferase-like protein
MRVIQNLQAALAHWVYSKEEWSSYKRWETSRRGALYSIFAKVFPRKCAIVPEITITGQKIWIDDQAVSFMDNNNKLKRVSIRDIGNMNILEITYEQIKGNTSGIREIRIPVPKGKLKEAIEVQDCLSGNTF